MVVAKASKTTTKAVHSWCSYSDQTRSSSSKRREQQVQMGLAVLHRHLSTVAVWTAARYLTIERSSWTSRARSVVRSPSWSPSRIMPSSTAKSFLEITLSCGRKTLRFVLSSLFWYDIVTISCFFLVF